MKEQSVTGAQRIDTPKSQLREPFKKRLFTVKEASVYLGRTIPSIRELYWSGQIPVVKVGRRTHFDLVDLDRFVERHKTTYTF